MGSFKLQKYGSEKEAAKSLGVFLIIIGLVIALLIHGWAGLAMVAVGLVLLIATAGASE